MIRVRLLLLVLLLLPPAHRVSAHSFEPALLDIQERGGGLFDVRWKLPLQAALLGAGDNFIPEFPAQCRRLGQSSPAPDAPALWQIDCGAAGLGGATLAVAGLEGSRLDVIVRITWSDGATVTGALRSGAEAFVVPVHTAAAAGTRTSAQAVLSSYVRLGIDHILSGSDHLLFVLGLIMLVPTWGMLLKTISAFTLAHSLTLALAVLGLVHVPPAPVEAMIALSIVLLAAELTRVSQDSVTLTRRYPWLVAFVFGLLHGLGFAGALAQTGLPSDQIALALVAFNVGVEIGQLAFVLAMIGPITVLRRTAWLPARLVPAYAIGGVAAGWLIERVQRLWVS